MVTITNMINRVINIDIAIAVMGNTQRLIIAYRIEYHIFGAARLFESFNFSLRTHSSALRTAAASPSSPKGML